GGQPAPGAPAAAGVDDAQPVRDDRRTGREEARPAFGLLPPHHLPGRRVQAGEGPGHPERIDLPVGDRGRAPRAGEPLAPAPAPDGRAGYRVRLVGVLPDLLAGPEVEATGHLLGALPGEDVDLVA